MLTYNQLEEATRPCLESIVRNTTPGTYELIVVDNASCDGTPEYLREFARSHPQIILQLNATNKGYAGGNNDGLRLAKGEFIILLNNDTLVPPGWLERLLAVFANDSAIGMAGPISNSVGNEQRVELAGLTEDNYERLAGEYTDRQAGLHCRANKLGFYCVAMPKRVFEKVGLLDEQFGLGTFEDDDYCLRVRKAGFALAVTEDCFVYHKGSVSFKKLSHEHFAALVASNKARYLAKHGESWTLTDIAFSYWRRIRDDIEAFQNQGSEDRNIERIRVRIENFYHLLVQIRQEEIKTAAQTLPHRATPDKWSRRWRNFKTQFLFGNMSQRMDYVRSKRTIFAQIRHRRIIRTLSQITQDSSYSQGKQIYILTPTVDYNYMKQRPQQLADALAASGHIVCYLTKNYNRDKVNVFERVKENLFLINERALGFIHHVFPADRITLVQLWPNNIYMKNVIPHRQHVYDIMDDISLLDLDKRAVEEMHLQSMLCADLITVSADNLLRLVPKEYQGKAMILPNGVSDEFIAKVQEAAPPPLELAANSVPVRVGYYGAIAEWFDFEIVEHAALALPDWQFVLIGPVFGVQSALDKMCSRCRNVLYLPQREYDKLIPFLKAFDVCIIPFIKNDITDAVSPVKLFEYMAAGKPVVTSDMPECRKYPNVRIAFSPEEFVTQLKSAKEEGQGEVFRSRQLEIAKQNTWGERVKTLQTTICSC